MRNNFVTIVASLGGDVRPRDAIKKLHADGWRELPGGPTSHKQFKHPTKPKKVTVTIKGGIEMSQRDIESIRKQADLSKSDWDKL
jgi:predicted RNA binding protein YcfA (HicA-like mRNA interferase family)